MAQVKKASPVQFWSGMVLPRARKILLDRFLVLAPCLAASLFIVIRFGLGADISIASAAQMGFRFASVGAAGAVTALAVTIGFAQNSAPDSWVRRRNEDSDDSPLETLAVVYLWAGFSQITLAATCAFSVAAGGDAPLFPGAASLLHQVFLGLSLFVFSYAVLQIFAVMQTLAQMAVVASRLNK